MRSRGLTVFTDSVVHEIELGAVQIRDLYTDAVSAFFADTVVVVGRQRPRDELLRSLRDLVAAVHVEGDSYAPRTMISAVNEGDLAARRI